MNRSTIGFLWGAIISGASAACAAPVTFQGLGVPDGSFTSLAYGISGDGTVAVGTSQHGNGFQAFRWTQAGGIVGIGDLPGGAPGGFDQQSFARATSFDGGVVVGYGSTNAGREGFRWTQAGGMVGIGDIPGGPFRSEAYGVSSDGTILVGRGNIDTNSDFSLAFRGSAGSLASLGDLAGGSTNSGAYGVSVDGVVVVGYGSDGSFSPQPMRWSTFTGMQRLSGQPSDTFGEALGVSADGTLIVGYTKSVFGTDFEQAFRWTASDGVETLGDLSGGLLRSVANAASADGSVIGGYGTSASGNVAAIWREPTTAIDLKAHLLAHGVVAVAAWQLTEVTGVSADGLTFVGNGEQAGFGTRAWIATIPEPSSLVLAILGAAALMARPLARRRK